MRNKVSYLEHLNQLVKDMPAEVPDDYCKDVIREGEHVFDKLISAKGLEKRKVLIVGGAGYIGVPLTFYLLKRGYDVKCLDLLLYSNRHCIHGFLGEPGYEFIYGDMADPNVVQRSLDGVTDVVILAGLVGDPITKLYPKESNKINDSALVQLIKNLNGNSLNRVVFISTCSNYGEIPEDALADESYELKPLSLYAKSKVAIENEILKLKNKVDFCATVLRFATAFGLSGRMRFDLTVSEFTREMFVNKTIEVYDADTWRPYCHVRDFARAISTVLEAPKSRIDFEVFNAGGDINNFTKGMLVDCIGNCLPDAQVKYVSGGVDRRNYKVDFSKIQNSLYFTPRYSVEDGVSELIKALTAGFFADYKTQLNIYRNKKINYIGPSN